MTWKDLRRKKEKEGGTLMLLSSAGGGACRLLSSSFSFSVSAVLTTGAASGEVEGNVWQNFPLSNRPVCFYNQSHAYTHTL